MYLLNMLDYLLISAMILAVVSGGIGKPMKFKAPNEEDTHSVFLPAEVKCDGCLAIAYQLNKQFNDFNDVHKHYKLKLPESELIELSEKICSVDTFKDYGLKEVEGVRSITGEGLKKPEGAGVISGGGKWPGRIAQMCASFVEELGEDGVYSLYKKDVNNVQALEDQLCHGSGILGACNKNIKQAKVNKSDKRANNEL